MVKKVKSENKINSTDPEHKMDLYFQEESAGNISGKVENHPEPTPAETPTEIQVGITLGDWNCPQCTLVNEPRNRFCSACGFQNKSFPSKKRKKREPEETSDLKEENTLQISKNTDEISPRESSDMNLNVRSPDGPQLLDPASIPVGANWLCPQCTCENEYKNRYCVACSYYFRRIAKPNLLKTNRKSDPKGDLDHSAGKSIEMEEETEQPVEPAFTIDENADEWHCPQCTFENPIRNRYCDACRFDRRPASSQQKKKRLSLEPPPPVVSSSSSRKSIEPEESKSNSASKKRTPSKSKSSSEIPLTPTPKSPPPVAAAAADLSSPLPATPSPQKKTKKLVVPTEKESVKPAEALVVVSEGKKGKAETRSVVIEEPSSSLPFFAARETRSSNKTSFTQPSIIPPAQLKAEEREKEKEKQPSTPVKTASRPPRTKKNATSLASTTTNGDDQDTPLLSKKRTVSSSQSTERLEDSENDTDRQEENDEMVRMKRIDNSMNNNNSNSNNSSQWECPSCQYKNRKDFVHCFRCHLPNKTTVQATSSQAKGKQQQQKQSNKAQEVGDISRKIFGSPPESQSSVVPVKKEGKNKKKNDKKKNKEAKRKEVSTVSTSPMSNNPFAPMMNPLMMTDPVLFQQLLSSSTAPTIANSTSSNNAITAPFLMNPFLAFPFMNPFLQLTQPNTTATVNPPVNSSPLFVSPSLLPHQQAQVPPARPAMLRSASAESSNSSFRINSDFSNLQQNNQQINSNVNNAISRSTTSSAAGTFSNNDHTLLLAQALLGNNTGDVLGGGANLNENLLQAYQRYLSSLQQQYQTTTTNWTQPRTSSGNINAASSSAANKNGPAAAASSSHKNDEVSGFLVIKSEGFTDLVNDCASDLTTSSATADGESSQQQQKHHQPTDPPSVQEEAYHYLSNNGGIREKTFKPVIGSNSQAEIPPLNVEEDPYDYYWKSEKNSNDNSKKYQENNEYYEVIWLSNSELLDIPDDLEPTVDLNRPKRRTRTTFTTYPWDELPAKSPKAKEDKIVTLNDFAERFSDNQVTALHSLWKSNYCYNTALKDMERLEEEKKHYKHDVSLLILNKEERERFKKAISRYGNDDWNHVAVSFSF
jgi:hypothetical protein